MNLPGRVLALDVGRVRIGVAVSDPLGYSAQGLETLQRTNLRGDMEYFTRLAREYEACLFLLGLPLHMRSGDESRQAGYVREFGMKLEKATGVPVDYWDERLTTVEALRVLRSSGIGIEKRAQARDKLSAVILLNSYLAAQGGA